VAFNDLRRWQLERRARRKARVAMLRSFAHRTDGGTAQALVELSSKVGTNWEESIHCIVAFDADVLHVERVSFWSLNEDTSSIRCEVGYDAGLRSFEHGATLFESDLPEYFAALRLGRAIVMNDVLADARCCGLRDYCLSRGIGSMLDVPVWVEGRLRGVLCHEHVGAPRQWTPREEDLATSVTQIVSSALAARAHTHAEAAARRAAFLDTVSFGMSSLSSRQVADRTISACMPTLADMSLVWVRGSDGELELRAFRHCDPAKHEILTSYERARQSDPRSRRPALANRVVQQEQAFLIPEINPDMFDRYGITPQDRDMIAELGISTVVAVPASCGETVGALTFMAANRHYEAEDLQLAEEIGTRLGAALENARLYEVAREAIRARDDLLVLTAHELRTPLTALQLTADQMLRKARRRSDSAEVARFEPMARQVRRFGALVNHLIEALGIRAEGVTLTCSPCDLAAIVRERVALASEGVHSESLIAIEGPESLPGLWDRTRVEVVVDALLDNALKFGAGRPIVVSLRADGARAELSVRDEGIGISADRIAAIFHPFERAVPKEHYGGLGLGLYVAKALVDAHGGSIAVTSTPGAGATFVVQLPLNGGPKCS
jgi:signal transduction histidine kinase